jgi:phosphoribosyl 1,2-cyclic phosphodiesterase
MKLTFLGTKANIESRSPRHSRNSSLKIAYRRSSVVIDCGLDWLDLASRWQAAAIFLTHAHPDHAFGLQNGAPCPVYATAEAWQAIGDFPIEQRQIIVPRKPIRVGDLGLEAFPVSHSLRAPATGFRVAAGRRAIFYVPDVVDIEDRPGALAGIDLYVGDGSTMTRPLVRRRGGSLFGHTTRRSSAGAPRRG